MLRHGQPTTPRRKQRSSLSIHETLFCAIQKVYSQLSSRRAFSLFQNATERGQIDHAPHFNAPSKLFNNAEMTSIHHKLVMLSALPVAGLESDFSVDSAGFRTTTFSAYNGEKHGQKKEHQWLKAHLCAGAKTNVVAAVAKAYIPYKKNATGRAGGSALWKKMYHYFRLNRDEFMDHYHKRSNIEATNAAMKCKFGETLKSKNPVAQVNELLAKMVQSLSERNPYIPTIDVYYSWQRSTISFLSLLFSRRLLPPSYL